MPYDELDELNEIEFAKFNNHTEFNCLHCGKKIPTEFGSLFKSVLYNVEHIFCKNCIFLEERIIKAVKK